MAREPGDIVGSRHDVPCGSVNLSTGTTKPTDNTVTAYYLSNKDTRFENLIFAITNGFSAMSPPLYRTDQEFAERACGLARTIAYEMEKYRAT